MECPACPRPGWNIPDSWATSPLQYDLSSVRATLRSMLTTWIRWLYRRYLAIDANFRLSNRFSRSTEKSDPCLNDGRAFVISAKGFEAYLDKVERDKEGHDKEKVRRMAVEERGVYADSSL